MIGLAPATDATEAWYIISAIERNGMRWWRRRDRGKNDCVTGWVDGRQWKATTERAERAYRDRKLPSPRPRRRFAQGGPVTPQPADSLPKPRADGFIPLSQWLQQGNANNTKGTNT